MPTSRMDGNAQYGTSTPLLPNETHSNIDSPKGNDDGNTSHRVHWADSDIDLERTPGSEGERSSLGRTVSNPDDELRHIRSGLSWLGLDQSTPLTVLMSWILFSLFTFIVPIFNLTFVFCSNCTEEHQLPFDRLVQYSESALAAVSFLCLSHTVRKYGLRETLLLDIIIKESREVQQGYEKELDRAFSLLAKILLPGFLVELLHRLMWYFYVSISIRFVGHVNRKLNVAFGTASMLAWLYRTSVFLFMCVLFRLMCKLQLLRLQGYKKFLQQNPEVPIILHEHMRISSHLLTISHRYRTFILMSLFIIAISQLTSLFYLLSPAITATNFFRAGDLLVCSGVQLTGLVLCLHGAAKITHKAQQIVAIVSKWHAISTCTLADAVAGSMGNPPNDESSDASVGQIHEPAHPLVYNSDLESAFTECSPEVEQWRHDSEEYQKRQSLVSYLEHTSAGIKLYGFVLDRSLLYGMFGVTFSVTLFIIGKTVAI